jgi:hopene-associated glycosyltransferase HpnB
LSAALVALGALAGLAAAAWLAVLLLPDRGWRLRPTDAEGPQPPEPAAWPAAAIIVPARNEAEVLPQTLPALLEQDYPGDWRVVVVDDRSSDGTAAAARAVGARHPGGARLEVVAGGPLPSGWLGKVWALEQGLRHVRAADPGPEHLLLTDADIRHAPGSLRHLVAESAAGDLGIASRMARLRCEATAERLLVPPFVLFFNLMYPMTRVNRPERGPAAAAGGCLLVRRAALEAGGGFDAMRSAVIDDLALAGLVKGRAGRPIRLALSRGDVRSVREYRTIGPLWRMVRRSAFSQLRGSWALVAAVLVLLGVLFAAPPLALVLGAAGAVAHAAGAGPGPAAWAPPLATGALALAAMAAVAGPSVRYFGLRPAWRLALPLAGVLYGGMTLDSALRGREGPAADWRAPGPAPIAPARRASTGTRTPGGTRNRGGASR